MSKWEVKLRYDVKDSWASLEVYATVECNRKKLKKWCKQLLKNHPSILEIRANVEGSPQGHYFSIIRGVLYG